MTNTRPPQTPLENFTANCRPQPAIPAVLVLLICAMLVGPALGGGTLVGWGLTVGVLASCGLAIAAGFCSFFPTAIWIALALLLFGRSAASLPLHTQVALYGGVVAAAGMIGVQVWRVRTGRFVPTITEPAAEPGSDS